MKKIIKFILILLLLAIIIIFYRTNFKEENNDKSKVDLEEKDQINLSPSNNDNNLIKNLKYEINLDEINKYHHLRPG